jgi:hypothetical protein
MKSSAAILVGAVWAISPTAAPQEVEAVTSPDRGGKNQI